MTGRYRICISDSDICGKMEGINPQLRGLLVEQAVMAFLRTDAGRDLLRVLKNRSRKGNREQNSAARQEEGEVLDTGVEASKSHKTVTKTSILEAVGSFH